MDVILYVFIEGWFEKPIISGAFREPGEITACSTLLATKEAIKNCANSFFGNNGIYLTIKRANLRKLLIAIRIEIA